MSIAQAPPPQRTRRHPARDHHADYGKTSVDYADAPLWLKIADAEENRLRHAKPGAD